MVDDRIPRPEESRVLGKIGSWLLIIPSAVIGIIAVELFIQLFFSSIYSNTATESQRVIFFDGPALIFKNHEDIFTYMPDSEIRNLTAFFFQDGTFSIEYDYRFRTNNFGLVQDTGVAPDRDSLLLLGDSFTEGQGAKPWFPLVSPAIVKRGYQAVNGGLLGTGFEQWNKLQRYLAANNIRIRKVVVVFISDDFRRPVWQPTPAALQCLSTPTLCRVEDSYFYRLPPPDELASWITRIRTARTPIAKKSWQGALAEALLPASYHIYGYFKVRYFGPQHGDPTETARFEHAQRQSPTAIAELINTYGRENVVFIHLPAKDEIGRSLTDLGVKARRSIGEAGGRLVDGFKVCGLTPNDYYRNDGHPNRDGYAKIAACISNAIAHM